MRKMPMEAYAFFVFCSQIKGTPICLFERNGKTIEPCGKHEESLCGSLRQIEAVKTLLKKRLEDPCG